MIKPNDLNKLLKQNKKSITASKKPLISEENDGLVEDQATSLPEAYVNHIHASVIDYADHTIMYELHYMESHFEDYASELTDQLVTGGNEAYDDNGEWDKLNAEISKEIKTALNYVRSRINDTLENLKSEQTEISRSTAMQSSTITVDEALESANLHGKTSFDKIKQDITNMIKNCPDITKNLQALADRVYNYVNNEVPDALLDDAEMLADQLLEKYSGLADQDERERFRGEGPIDSKELRKAMDRSVGLESGKIGDFLNTLKKNFPGRRAYNDHKFNKFMEELEGKLINTAKWCVKHYETQNVAELTPDKLSNIRRYVKSTFNSRLAETIRYIGYAREYDALQDEEYKNKIIEWLTNRSDQLRKLTLKKLNVPESKRLSKSVEFTPEPTDEFK